jgi:hypothetical protein
MDPSPALVLIDLAINDGARNGVVLKAFATVENINIIVI